MPPGARYLLQGLWTAALLVLLASFLEPFVGRMLPRGPVGSWIVGAARVWLVASFFAFFAFQSVEVVGWISRVAGKALAQRSAFDPSRRELFRYAAYMAGSLPFL